MNAVHIRIVAIAALVGLIAPAAVAQVIITQGATPIVAPVTSPPQVIQPVYTTDGSASQTIYRPVRWGRYYDYGYNRAPYAPRYDGYRPSYYGGPRYYSGYRGSYYSPYASERYYSGPGYGYYDGPYNRGARVGGLRVFWR